MTLKGLRLGPPPTEDGASVQLLLSAPLQELQNDAWFTGAKFVFTVRFWCLLTADPNLKQRRDREGQLRRIGSQRLVEARWL